MNRVALIQLPTPLHRLARISEQLGIELWIKRDDLTGFALGGNKGRKLEFLIADVLEARAEVVVTCGSTQSNFIRQLGAACVCFGIECSAAVMHLPFENVKPAGKPAPRSPTGNLLLDEILGVDLDLLPDGTWEALYAAAEDLALHLEREGKRVYRIPVGGSSPLGAYGFVEAARELTQQAPPFDQIVFASSSGSTQVGLAHALIGSGTKVMGIACDPEPEIVEDFADLAASLAELLHEPRTLRAEDFRLDSRFVGPGYGVPSDQGDAAIRLLARAEGIFLDPIYSGKAFAGLLQMAQEGALPGRTLFWHTGGIPALFA